MLRNCHSLGLATFLALLSFLSSGLLRGGEAPPVAFKRSPDLFRELLGRSPSEISAKIDAAWQQLFFGNDEQRFLYSAGNDTAYIADVASTDVRTEGMSYGMMIAVQLGKRTEFDRIWRWAKTHMYHPDGPRKGYFAWQCRYDGSQIDPGSASDGEEWFAMALLFASHRWGNNDGAFHYGDEAQALLEAMRNGQRGGEITAIFDAEHHQVVFAPTQEAARFTDPSYHLPAFYELWARWDKSKEGREFWRACASESRSFFHRAAHPRTGLMPEYAEFDGRPRPGEKGDFRYDAWRTIANVAIDHAWFGRDPWQVGQVNRVLTFLAQQGSNSPNQFTLDGTSLSKETSAGLYAMAAVGALAADKEVGRPFVQRLWEMPIPSGRYRYYDGILYFLALLQTSGRFQIIEPSPESVTEVWSPVPPVVQAPRDRPPSDAIVLFDGTSLDAWEPVRADGSRWKIEDGAMVVVPNPKPCDMRTKQSFGDVQLHLEWRSPNPARGKGQDRGNSGIFFMGLYELQVLDSYSNSTYVNGQAGAIYKEHAPLVNASRAPGEWQTYDVVFVAPRFEPNGALAKPARMTVFHNGVIVQHDVVLTGPTPNGETFHQSTLPEYRAHAERLPLVLQDHRHPVAFRNIWIRELVLPEK